MKVKFKKLNKNAVTPFRAHPNDAGLDLTSTSKEYCSDTNTLTFGTSLAIQLPKGYVGLLVPRSSVYKTGLSLSNCCGILDADYSGEIKFKYYIDSRPKKNYEIGDRIGQLIVIKLDQYDLEEVERLDDTERGEGSFGSSDL